VPCRRVAPGVAESCRLAKIRGSHIDCATKNVIQAASAKMSTDQMQGHRKPDDKDLWEDL